MDTHKVLFVRGEKEREVFSGDLESCKKYASNNNALNSYYDFDPYIVKEISNENGSSVFEIK